MSLTLKQEKFCQCIVSGMTAKDSYFSAYDTKCSDRVAINEGSKLMLREDIQARIKTMIEPLQAAAQSKAMTERERIKQILWDRLQKAIDREDDATIVKITDQINRMNAEYINTTKVIEDKKSNIDDLDTETLQKLADGT